MGYASGIVSLAGFIHHDHTFSWELLMDLAWLHFTDKLATTACLDVENIVG